MRREGTFIVDPRDVNLVQAGPGDDMDKFGLSITVSHSKGPTQPAPTLGAHQLIMKTGLGI